MILVKLLKLSCLSILIYERIYKNKAKGMTEDEMVGWNHRLDGHEFDQALGVGDGQGCLVCCSPWGRKKLDTTEQLIWRKKVNCVSSSFSNPGSFNLSTISERYMSFPTISLWALWAESEAWSSHSWFIIELLFEPSASLESCLWDVYTFMSMSIHRQVMSMKLLTGVGGLPFYPMCPL